MQSKARTVKAYLDELPPDRRTALQAVRDVFLKNIDKDYEESMGYGMPGFYVPHSIYPASYPLQSEAATAFRRACFEKNYMSVYLTVCMAGGNEEASRFRDHLDEDRQEARHGQIVHWLQKVEDLGAGCDR